MKRVLFLTLLICILSGCNLLKQEGIILEKSEVQDGGSQILVVSNISEEDISNKTTAKLNEMVRENDAALYRLDPDKYEELEIGTHVIVYWNGDSDNSDPPQREAKKIDVVSE